MQNKLSLLQCRIIGVMLEKEITTPEQYPLSLNGLTNACNQKSSREPVMSLSESEVQNTLDELAQLKLINDQGAFSGRVAKYSHRFCNTEFGSLKFTSQQRAIICVLLLRGAQTPGELRTRTNRLTEFSNVNEVESCLVSLTHFNDDVLVKKLPREPGKRDSRYCQLFSEHVSDLTESNEEIAQEHSPAAVNSIECESENELSKRVIALEQKVMVLEEKLDNLLSELK
jgi:uncharacterized protein YceH (UPF0502 family)